jgi:cation diffusion facilitator CzcD-associated flavoprotein CzcO
MADRLRADARVGNKTYTSATVVIIGAGISGARQRMPTIYHPKLTAIGMCMAIDLIKRNSCHNFVILEKSSGVGGTWHDNKYPGCCCDG